MSVTIYCSSSTADVLKVNTVSNAAGTFSYEVDDPVQVLHSSVELHSAFLYQTPSMVCTISAITVNASVETLPGTSLFTFSLQCFNTYHHTLHLAHALVHLSCIMLSSRNVLPVRLHMLVDMNNCINYSYLFIVTYCTVCTALYSKQ